MCHKGSSHWVNTLPTVLLGQNSLKEDLELSTAELRVVYGAILWLPGGSRTTTPMSVILIFSCEGSESTWESFDLNAFRDIRTGQHSSIRRFVRVHMCSSEGTSPRSRWCNHAQTSIVLLSDIHRRFTSSTWTGKPRTSCRRFEGSSGINRPIGHSETVRQNFRSSCGFNGPKIAFRWLVPEGCDPKRSRGRSALSNLTIQ